ncbi:MAG: RIP metalloprotease RseP [Synergistes sp.]|nr:RIP metalloprotease RseP [Synergistes sp.]
MLSIISFIIVIAICVISHEGGHFVTARLRNVFVHEFSFGMGPLIWKHQKGETQYSLRAFPVGGFVKLEGEDAEDEEDTERVPVDPARSLENKKPWEKLLIISAGALVNIFLAWLLTALFLVGRGVYDMERPKVGAVMPNTPAAECGLRSGDLIKSIDGVSLKDWADIRKKINAENKKGDLYVIETERDGTILKFTVKIPVNEESKSRLLGVQPARVTYPLHTALGRSLKFSWNMSVEILRSMYRMLSGQMKADVTGPVGIAVMAGDAVRDGFWTFISFLGMINLNLGLLNLLPFPALDGGRILFIAVEMVTRKKVPQKIESSVHYFGLIVLLGLIALITGYDIIRFLR